MAFDFQRKQRILTKIREHREQIESLVGYIDEEENYKDGKLGNILPKDNFAVSRDYLIQKSKELIIISFILEKIDYIIQEEL